LSSHTQKCIFIGYPPEFKAWHFWNPETKKEIVSNHAQFDERYFPGMSRDPLDWPSSAEDLPPSDSEDRWEMGILCNLILRIYLFLQCMTKIDILHLQFENQLLSMSKLLLQCVSLLSEMPLLHPNCIIKMS
jgi:hypothetical protein